MQDAIMRRREILEIISDRRLETAENLAKEFSVSVRTIYRDIEILSCSAPIYTVQGNNGGIRAADGWYINRRHLSEEQEKLLRRLLPQLDSANKKIMNGILSAFAVPTATGEI